MSAPLKQIVTSTKIPVQADVVVIGGGIVGSCSAYYLARRGLKVALVEKGRIGAEQSSRSWGWCRQQNRDARELPISIHSLALWDAFASEIGESVGFSRCGLLYLSNDQSELDGWAKWRDFAIGEGVVTNMLSSNEATANGKATGRRWLGGVSSPSDGTADPSIAVPVIAIGVQKLGGTVHQHCAARGLELSGGSVSGVITEHGVIKTHSVVMAGGAWASSFLHQQKLRFPQASVRSSILAMAPCNDLPDTLHTSEVSFTRRGDGGHTVAISGKACVDLTPQQIRFGTSFLPMFLKRWRALSPGGFEGFLQGHESLKRWRLDRPTPMEKNRVLNPKIDTRQIKETLRRARSLFPALAETPMTSSWASYIDSTPDGVPAIGATDIPGLTLAAGFSGHGFGIGPGAGHLVADILTGSKPVVDPRPYDPARLKQGVWGKVADF